MTSSEVWDERTAAAYDDDVAEMYAPDVLGPTVDALEHLAEGGPVLELAVGTGRLAIPLVERGLRVTGIELSQPMVARLRRKVDDAALPVVVGDMSTTTVPGEFSLVLLAYNSLSNLQTQPEQVACFANAARHLRPGGRFVVELWVPQLGGLVGGTGAVVRAARDGFIAFDTYDVATQACTSQTFGTGDDGAVTHDIGHFRYAWPSECDLMAALAGLELESRWSDWRGSPFTSGSASHVSVWRKP